MIVSGEPFAPVHTSRLRLRLPEEPDAAQLALLMSPAISARLASWPASFPPPIAAERLAEARALFARHRALPLVIERRSDGRLVGWIGAVLSATDPERAILTYWLGEAFHGQGLMREAAPAALAAAFRCLGAKAVRAAVQSDNLASVAVLRALGMRPLGPGRIWCGARGREEACEWWEAPRPIAEPAAMADEMLPVIAALPAAVQASGAHPD